MLILAGISIATLTGENGILTKANTAKEGTQIATIIEEARIKILELQAENDGKITTEQAHAIIAKYDKDYEENQEFTFKKDKNEEDYIATKEGYNILVKDIWTGPKEITFFLDALGESIEMKVMER